MHKYALFFNQPPNNTPGSSPKHTIYAFYSQICTVFVIVL